MTVTNRVPLPSAAVTDPDPVMPHSPPPSVDEVLGAQRPTVTRRAAFIVIDQIDERRFEQRGTVAARWR